ncbi:MAG: radical SAM protein [Desulfofustis sp. PB-SRB1]|jgi:radical SAM superfamily enzyme YgiQ (UPF0313 family)|nr:radical SAM protein [Desulfofustis sp. PB-SRB1]MBM1001547.1 radical SAM protein [Desulfofustis sp. PB-SRB1]HBH27358.1 radical SAM protein [Desulfofustis sp.]HBH31442.1 radical SAM protein [Desulfofustis sp.]
MHYEGNIFRPPSEANSILLQVTTGCSHNKCTFCGMYKGSQFSIKDDATIAADIDFAARNCRGLSRLFLCDGDALIIPHQRLQGILGCIKEKLPWVNRVGTYANAKSILLKSVEQLEELRQLGLTIAYLGLESGDDTTLTTINKGATSADMIEAGNRLKEAGIKRSITVLLGIAGPDRSLIHARQTGRVLSEIDPEFVGVLSLMLTPNTPLYQAYQNGSFRLAGPYEMLRELREMLAETKLSGGLFYANHASNYLPIKARLPKGKSEALAQIDAVLAGDAAIKPEYLRAL